MISAEVYQGIFDELSKYLIPGWEQLIVYLEYGEASYSFSFYIKTASGYLKCYDLDGVSDDDLFDSFEVIDKLVSKERLKSHSELWTNMTMVVSSAGMMKTDFDYTDLSECAYLYQKQWKEKYLK